MSYNITFSSLVSYSDPNLTQINYESYVHVKTNEKFLLRMINMGYQVVPWHIHGWHFMVVGKDSHINPFLALAKDHKHINHELIEMGFTNTIGSRETYDLIVTAEDKRGLYRDYIVNGKKYSNNYSFPFLCQQLKELYKTFDPNDPNDKFFPQFYPMHNHDDYKVTNDGIYPGGQLTIIQTDAPDKSM